LEEEEGEKQAQPRSAYFMEKGKSKAKSMYTALYNALRQILMDYLIKEKLETNSTLYCPCRSFYRQVILKQKQITAELGYN
jgi:hypothetical protein